RYRLRKVTDAVTGQVVWSPDNAEPRVYLAPVGTYVIDLLGMTGVTTENSHNLMCIDGGPMMGERVDVGKAAVRKTTNGLLVTDRGLFNRRDEARPTWHETLPEIMRKMGIERYLDWEPKEVHDVTSEIKRVKLYLKQCTGQASLPLVEPGQMVKEGQLIGKAVEGELPDFKRLSVNLHAPFSGEVKEVTEDYIIIERSQR
ncbi:TPA: hypothetical protein EYP12_01525, partial [Candidatus Bipolaricaulota bacterium]|nr:hypothetical protein [Candidatus Bipolaricaulota bacterium]